MSFKKQMQDASGGELYLMHGIVEPYGEVYKIGISNDPTRRVKEVQRERGDAELVVSYPVRSYLRHRELFAHSKWTDGLHHAFGEWFYFSDDELPSVKNWLSWLAALPYPEFVYEAIIQAVAEGYTNWASDRVTALPREDAIAMITDEILK